MSKNKIVPKSLNSSSYKGALTREQFLFDEMRMTSELLCRGLTDDEIIKEVYNDNLFQYPTERTIKSIVRACLRRLHALENLELVEAIHTQSSSIAKQICLYAMMKENHLVWDFMITVIGEKYRLRDLSFSRSDLDVFFMRLQEQNDAVASWRLTTIERIKSVLVNILVENEYLDNTKSNQLNLVLINLELEDAIRTSGDFTALLAFNCFS